MHSNVHVCHTIIAPLSISGSYRQLHILMSVYSGEPVESLCSGPTKILRLQVSSRGYAGTERVGDGGGGGEGEWGGRRRGSRRGRGLGGGGGGGEGEGGGEGVGGSRSSLTYLSMLYMSLSV